MLRDLFNEGLSISEIARQTGHDRKTIRKYINIETPPLRKDRPEKPGKLDPFKDYIIRRLNEHCFSALRLYREIKDQGFTGKYRIVKNFIREVRPKNDVPAVYRYETKPGVQAQVDWAECGKIEIDGKIRKLYCFTMILGFSRMRFAEFTLQIDVFALIQCHLKAFSYFGGYPQEIHYDNMKKTSYTTYLSLYRNKDVVEKGFDVLKNDIELMPANLRTNSSLRGYFFISFLALILRMKLTRMMTDAGLNKKYSLEGLFTELKKIKIIVLPDGEKITTEITKKQREILETLQMCA